MLRLCRPHTLRLFVLGIIYSASPDCPIGCLWGTCVPDGTNRETSLSLYWYYTTHINVGGPLPSNIIYPNTEQKGLSEFNIPSAILLNPKEDLCQVHLISRQRVPLERVRP